MKLAAISFSVIILVTACQLTSCIKDAGAATGEICDTNRSTLLKADNLEGRMEFNYEANHWTVNVSIPGTIDGLRTCIICGELPASLKQPGLKVMFSGELKESNGYPRPQLGGQVIYYVRPTSINKVP